MLKKMSEMGAFTLDGCVYILSSKAKVLDLKNHTARCSLFNHEISDKIGFVNKYAIILGLTCGYSGILISMTKK